MPSVTPQAGLSPAFIGRGVQGGAGAGGGGWGDLWRDNRGKIIESGLQAAGQVMTGREEGARDDRQLDIQQRYADMREQQQLYEQGPEYWKRQLMLRGPTGRWA
jgi:hypothetical protein